MVVVVETAEASQAPGMGGVVALVEAGSEAEARNEVLTEHLIVNFDDPKWKEGDCSILYHIKIGCSCVFEPLGKMSSTFNFFFFPLLSTTLVINKILFTLKSTRKK